MLPTLMARAPTAGVPSRTPGGRGTHQARFDFEGRLTVGGRRRLPLVVVQPQPELVLGVHLVPADFREDPDTEVRGTRSGHAPAAEDVEFAVGDSGEIADDHRDFHLALNCLPLPEEP